MKYKTRKAKYVDGLPVSTHRPRLNGHGDDYCPRCGHGGILIRDIVDICCLRCGWRESNFFGTADLGFEIAARYLASDDNRIIATLPAAMTAVRV